MTASKECHPENRVPIPVSTWKGNRRTDPFFHKLEQAQRPPIDWIHMCVSFVFFTLWL